MEDKIKAAFGAIRANEELKSDTKAFVAQKTRGYKKRRALNFDWILPAAAAVCLAIIIVSGIAMYFTPTARISIDINPSLELEINRFDRVIAVNALNEDGEKLAQSLDIRFADYDEAIRKILESKCVESLLSEDEFMTITVIETNSAQSERILSDVRVCANGHNNVYCHSASSEEASAARKLGLSLGKYRAYLELRELDPDIAPEEIQGLTMREIRNRIAALLSEDVGNELPPTTSVIEPPPTTSTDEPPTTSVAKPPPTTSTGEPPTTSVAEPPPTNGNGHHGNGHEHGHE